MKLTSIAIIYKTKIIDKIIFEEKSEKALEIAKAFLETRHFKNAESVQILKDGYVIGDYFIDGEFVKAAFYALLDEENVVTKISRRPEGAVFTPFNQDEGGIIVQEVPIAGNIPGLIGMMYIGGEFVPPPPEPTNGEIFRLVMELKEEVRQLGQ
ncbi:MAG: hypothetical protein FWE24_09255 [Defluviitaleaceae bacterium]|nr:hypothetical protein [Defluviitaleaceae bacterium]